MRERNLTNLLRGTISSTTITESTEWVVFQYCMRPVETSMVFRSVRAMYRPMYESTSSDFGTNLYTD
jgi:hypothetical protein